MNGSWARSTIPPSGPPSCPSGSIRAASSAISAYAARLTDPPSPTVERLPLGTHPRRQPVSASSAMVRCRRAGCRRHRRHGSRRRRLGTHRAVRRHAPRLPARALRRREPGRRRRRVGALPPAHVRDHRLLPPLLLAPLLQDLARGAVRLRAARRLGGAARPDLVGRASSSSPRVLGQAAGPALAACSAASSGRTWAGSCRGATSTRTCAACATCCSTPSCAGSTASTSWCRSRSRWRCCSAGMALGALRAGPRHDRRADAGLGLLRLDGGLLPRHVHDQLALPCWGSRATATSDDSRNNRAARADHARRRLAQQPPPLSQRRAPGLLLVGDRHHLLPAARPRGARRDLGPQRRCPQPHPRRCARRRAA